MNKNLSRGIFDTINLTLLKFLLKNFLKNLKIKLDFKN